MIRLKIANERLSIPEKIQKGYHHAGMMEGNAFFPDAGPVLTEFREITKALEDAHQDALDGGRSKKMYMRSREREFDEALIRLAAYVEIVAKGDGEVIVSAGFDVRVVRRASQPAEVPLGITVSPGKMEGEVQVKWTTSERTRVYVAEMSTDGGLTWESRGTVTKGRMIVSGLPTGTKPWFRIAAIGTLGQSDWSDAAQGKVA